MNATFWEKIREKLKSMLLGICSLSFLTWCFITILFVKKLLPITGTEYISFTGILILGKKYMEARYNGGD